MRKHLLLKILAGSRCGMSNVLILLSVTSFVGYWLRLHHWPSQFLNKKLLILIVILCFVLQKFER